MASRLVLEFQGLMVLVLGRDQTSVICIDTTADQSGHMPMRHVPTLETDRFAIVEASSTPVAVYRPFKAAYGLDRCVMQVYPAGRPPAAHVRPTLVRDTPKSVVVPPDENNLEGWDTTEWLAQFNRVRAGLTLRPDWPTAPAVQARIDLSGGTLKAMQPEGPMTSAVWSFGDATDQIFTTRFLYELPGDDAGFEFKITSGGTSRFVYLHPRAAIDDQVIATVFHNPMIETEGVAVHVHAMAARAAGRALETVPAAHHSQPLANIVHVRACYELFSNPPAVRPIPEFVGFVGNVTVGETAGCIPTMIEAP